MNVLPIAAVMMLFLSIVAGGAEPPSFRKCVVPGSALIEWVDFVKWNDVTYMRDYVHGGRPLSETDLGPQVGEVVCQMIGNVSDPKYRPQNGDAGFLRAGTPLYQVKGYAVHFRLAARQGEEIRLFEVDRLEGARIGADILDLQGKVEYVGIAPVNGGPAHDIRDPAEVQALVEATLAAPVVPEGEPGGNAPSWEESYRLIFHFKDGTQSTRPYWPDSGLLWVRPGLRLPESFQQIVNNALDK